MPEGDQEQNENPIFFHSPYDTLILAKISSSNSIDPFNRIGSYLFTEEISRKKKKKKGEGSLLETTLDKSFGQNWEVRSLLTLVTSENTMLDDYKGRSLR